VCGELELQLLDLDDEGVLLPDGLRELADDGFVEFSPLGFDRTHFLVPVALGLILATFTEELLKKLHHVDSILIFVKHTAVVDFFFYLVVGELVKFEYFYEIVLLDLNNVVFLLT